MKNILTVCVLLFISGNLFSQSNYELVWSLNQKPFQPPQTASEMATVKAGFDTDQDGKGEFICSYTDLDSNYILMYEATNNNTYELVWYWKYPVAANTFANFVVGDLDNNGVVEIITTLPSQVAVNPNPPRLWVFQWNNVPGQNKYGLYTGDTFGPNYEWNFDVAASTDLRPYSLTIEDIDNDSQNELIVGIRQGGRGREVIVASVVGQFDGFASFIIEYNLQGLTGGSLYSVTTGDLDNDGKKEIYALIWNYFTIRIIEATGPNSYQLVKSIDTVFRSTGVDYGALDGVRVADVNGDGFNEMYIAGTEPDNTIFIVTNVTDVANLTASDFKVLTRLPKNAGGKLRTMQIFDTDKDGKMSLMIAGETNGQIFDVEYKGSGNPALAENWDVNIAFDIFQHSGFSPTASPTISPRLFYGSPANDMDGDGKNEYIVANYRTSFSVWAGDGYLWMIELKTATDVDNVTASPEGFILEQNYPNPFNPSTVISYRLSVNSYVTLKVYDLLGREIATLVNEPKQAGEFEIEFDASKYGLSSGVYLYQLTAGSFSSTKKFVFLQ